MEVFKGHFWYQADPLYAHCKIYFGNKQAHWMNSNKEYHDLNPDHS